MILSAQLWTGYLYQRLTTHDAEKFMEVRVRKMLELEMGKKAVK